MCKRVVSLEEASQWYTVVTGSLEQHAAQQDKTWDMISHTQWCDACWVDPKLPCRWGEPSRQVGRGAGVRDVQAGQ